MAELLCVAATKRSTGASITASARAFSMRISIDRSASRFKRTSSSVSRLALSDSKGRSGMAGDYTELRRWMQAKLHATSDIACFYTEAGRSRAFRDIGVKG